MRDSKHCLLLLFVLCCVGVSYALIGIDFGSRWIKMSVIRGNEFAVILDAASQRKSINAVSFEYGERYFGPDAERLVCVELIVDTRLTFPSTGIKKSFASIRVHFTTLGKGARQRGYRRNIPSFSLLLVLG